MQWKLRKNKGKHDLVSRTFRSVTRITALSSLFVVLDFGSTFTFTHVSLSAAMHSRVVPRVCTCRIGIVSAKNCSACPLLQFHPGFKLVVCVRVARECAGVQRVAIGNWFRTILRHDVRVEIYKPLAGNRSAYSAHSV
jgi:hypothetical protein